MWKATHYNTYPLDIKAKEQPLKTMRTREDNFGRLQESGITTRSQGTFIGDATRILNKAPMAIKESTSLGLAKY